MRATVLLGEEWRVNEWKGVESRVYKIVGEEWRRKSKGEKS